MADLKEETETIFESWTTPEVDIQVEYPAEVLDELRVAAADGLQRLARGGLEVGGVLFGTRRGSAVRILTWRPIECEHAHGPAFVLSNKDRANLARQLDDAQSDPDLQGLMPVGWFLSHTRSEIVLSPSNVDLFNLFFPWGWQITLVLRPGRQTEARAGIFVRQADGSLRTESSYREFTLVPLRREGPGSEKEKTRPEAEPMSRSLPGRPPEQPRENQPRTIAPPGRRPSLWLWAIPGCLALLIVGVLLKERYWTPPDPALAFRVVDEGATLRLEWNRASPAVRSSHEAILEIQDGKTSSRIVLTPERMREGNVAYGRQTGDVDLTMTVYSSGGGNPVRESARFIGPPAAPSAAAEPSPAMTDLQLERDRLEKEVKRLRSELGRATERADRAEHTVQILENRIQIENARKPDGEGK